MFFNTIMDIVMTKHEGAVAFEYIIILIIMAVALFIGFKLLQEELVKKAGDIKGFIDNNGQSTLAGGK